jgi:class 3 adenylate cyclase/DNA-binding winged helix-turn-helix (wHTH) protein/predicted ATPase
LFYFGDHTLDLPRRELRRGGKLVVLEPQVFDLIVYLVRNRDRVISKNALIEGVWGGRVVSDATIHSRIKDARQAIGDSGAGQHAIRTIPRKGVRFVAEVREQEEKAAPEQVSVRSKASEVRLDWLRGLGLEQYAPLFLTNEIDDRALPSLTAEDLSEMGVISIGHRRRLLDGIAALRSGTGNADLPLARAAAEISGQVAGIAEHRQLTVVLCELVGSTQLSTHADPEELHDLLHAFHAYCAEHVTRFGGYIEKSIGDGARAYFGYPRSHEDDSIRAIHAGLVILGAVANLPSENGAVLRVRIGVATGLVVVSDLIGRGTAQASNVVGATPNLAARLQRLADPGTMVIADTTRRLAGGLFEYRNLGEVALDGFSKKMQAWQVIGAATVQSRFDALHDTALTPLVGREEEIDLLLRRWQRAQAGEGQTVLVSGEPGIGKSRLIAELQERSGESHTRIHFFCSPYHCDSMLYPFTNQIERAAGFQRDDLAGSKLDKLEELLARSGESSAETAGLFADLLGLPAEGRYPLPPQEPPRKREATLAALMNQFEALARQRPVLMVFEDAHWVDSTSLELLDQMVECAARLHAMLVIIFRPEFTPTWVGQACVSSLSLNRLARRETGALVRGITAGKTLPPEILEQIVARTDGIPLFVEELTKSLLESGLVREVADGYALTGPFEPWVIPLSLRDSLMARLDRLASVKEVAQIGATVGREFTYELVAAVARRTNHDLDNALAQLTESGLLFRRGTPPRATFMFKHALVQEAAYSMLLRSQRQELHTRIGKALEEHFPEIVTMQPEILAHHFAQAGLLDDAVAYWRKAGEFALGRSANAEAAAHLSRGIELTQSLPAGHNRDRREFDLVLALGSATRAIHGHASPESLRVYLRARELLSDQMTVQEQIAVLYGLWSVNFVRAEFVAAEDVARQSLALAVRLENLEASAFADRMMGLTLSATGRFADAVPCLKRTIALFGPGQVNVTDLRYSQDHGVWALGALAITLWPLGFPQQAIEAAQQALERARDIGHAMTTGFAYIFGLMLNGLFQLDRQDRVLPNEASAYCDKQKLMAYLPVAQFYQGAAQASDGDRPNGINLMRESLAATEKIHFRFFLPTFLGHLASAYAVIGQTDLAMESLRHASQTVTQTHEQYFEAELYRLRGELLINQGEEKDGVTELKKALVVSRAQRARMWELRAATKLAGHWAERGKRTEARELLAQIYDWFTEGFDTLDLKEAKALLEKL